MDRNTEGFYNYRSSCLGIGAGSSSLFPGLRYNIKSNADVYIDDLIRKRRCPVYYGFFINEEDYKRQYIMTQFGLRRLLDKDKYRKLFGSRPEEDFPKEIVFSKKKGIVTERKNAFVVHFDERQMGHKDYFYYSAKYWYASRYIKKLAKIYNW